MNKKTLALTLGGAMVTVLATIPMVHAQENPFGLQEISSAEVVAAADEKIKEGKCGEAKCGANKTKVKESTDATSKEKMKEGTDDLSKEKTKEANPGSKT